MPLRAKITNQIFSETREKEMEKFASVVSGSEAQILKEEGAVAKLSTVYPQGVFMSERSLEVEQVRSKFPKFLKALEILAERGEWILSRLFEDAKGVLQERAFGVWLCLNFQWECFVVDDCIQVDEGSQPLFTAHSGTPCSIQAARSGRTSSRRRWGGLSAGAGSWSGRTAPRSSRC